MRVKYVPHAEVDEHKKRGWSVTDSLSWCHHGQHAVVMTLYDQQSSEHHQGFEPDANQ
jgi:hypothetical protein